MPAPAKKATGKIIAVVVVILVIIAAIAAYLVLNQPTKPPTANRAPTLNTVSADRTAADVSAQQVNFTASATDPDGDTLTYTWNFGDGTNATGATVRHAYAFAGNYIAVVSVDDGHNHVVVGDSKLVFLLVNHVASNTPPNPTDQPNPVAVMSADNDVVQTGTNITLSGNASWTWAYTVPDWTYFSAGGAAPTGNRTAMPTMTFDFGDGSAPLTGNATKLWPTYHVFTAVGSHFVKLTVTNYLGKSDSVGYTVRVFQAAPPATGVKNPDIFTEATFGEPDTVDPAIDYETSGGQVIQNVAETLIWYNGASATDMKPQLATHVPDPTNPVDVSPDGLTWNFTLRANVRFYTPSAAALNDTVSCKDVKFSVTRGLHINDPNGPAWILDQSLTNYATTNREAIIQGSVTCPDGLAGLKVQFHLAKAYPAFLATLAFTAGSVLDSNPAAYHASARCAVPGDLYNNTCDDQVVGTGPFALKVWQPNQQIILVANPHYWNAATKAVPFKEVHIIKANDIATRVLMMKAGDADYIVLAPSHKGDIRDTAGNVLPGITEYSGNTFNVGFLGMNQNINVSGAAPGDNVPANFFSDIHIRKAFAYAWDYNAYLQNVLYGYGVKLCGPVPSGMLGYSPSNPCYSHDLAQAQAEFQLALDGRTPAPGDNYWQNGFQITLYYNTGNLARQEGSQLLATVLHNLNPLFVVNVQGLEWATFLQKQRTKVLPLFFLGWAPDYADPDDYVVPFLRTGGTFPRTVGYSNTTLDGLIDSQSTELNQTARLNLLNQIQLAAYYDAPYIWTSQGKSQNVFRSWVTGFYSNPMTTAGTGNYYYDLHK